LPLIHPRPSVWLALTIRYNAEPRRRVEKNKNTLLGCYTFPCGGEGQKYNHRAAALGSRLRTAVERTQFLWHARSSVSLGALLIRATHTYTVTHALIINVKLKHVCGWPTLHDVRFRPPGRVINGLTTLNENNLTPPVTHSG
jgi:hypothetical protein